MNQINTPNAPEPGGHYSQAMVHNGMVFISGQLPIDPVTGTRITGEIEEQTIQVLKNLKSILEAANSGIDYLLKVNIYISDVSLWSKVNQIYADFIGSHRPARAIVPTRELHHGFKIEVEAVAAAIE